MSAEVIDLDDRKRRLIEWAGNFAVRLFTNLSDEDRKFLKQHLERELNRKE